MANPKKILVIGLGRVGLPLALTMIHENYEIYGYAPNKEAIDQLQNHITLFDEPGIESLLKKHVGKNFFPIGTWAEVENILPDLNSIIFSISTPTFSDSDIVNNRNLDLQSYYDLFDKIFKSSFQKPLTLVLRSTLPLGSTDTFKAYIEAHYAYVEGKDFYLCFVPERMKEGAALEELHQLPKIVGAYNDQGFQAVEDLFKPLGGEILRVKNPLSAEFCKLTDNSFRSTLFGYANDLAIYADELDIDIYEIIRTVNKHYDRNHLPTPGFVSGYCLSKDPYIFEKKFLSIKEQRKFHSVWYYARRTNDYFTNFIAEKINHSLTNPNAIIALLGLSFAPNIDDFRFSHSEKILELFIQQGRKHFKVYDPFLEQNSYTNLNNVYKPYILEKATVLTPSFFKEVQAVVLLTPHQALIDLNQIATLKRLFSKTSQPLIIFDFYGIWSEYKSLKNVHYVTLGEV